MKKLIVFTAAILALTTLISSCGKKSPTVKKYEYTSNSNTYYDVGDFSVYVPDKWEAIPQNDIEDSKITLKNTVMLAKSPAFDENTGVLGTDGCACFYIRYFDSDSLDQAPANKKQWTDVKDMDDIKIGDNTWHGILVKKAEYDMVVMWTSVGDHGYRLSADIKNGFGLDENDVQTALKSLK